MLCGGGKEEHLASSRRAAGQTSQKLLYKKVLNEAGTFVLVCLACFFQYWLSALPEKRDRPPHPQPLPPSPPSSPAPLHSTTSTHTNSRHKST